MALALVRCHGNDVGHDGGLVGGGCGSSRDCVERCVTGGDYPGGTCTVNCRDDFDCPDTTYCVDRRDGICLLGCGSDRDCRPRYECSDERRHGHRGDIPVCIGD
jgi:hypothetical protein